MAYKFQVGPAILSGSTTFEDALQTKSSFAATSVSASAAVSGGSLDIGGNADIDGELDVGGLFKMADNTSGKLLIGDNTSYEEVAMSGDITIDGAGVTTIGAGKVTNSMLSGGIANAKLVNDAVTLTAGAGMGTLGAVALGSSITVAVDGVLEDLDSLGAASADGQFIVSTGAGTFAYESDNTARTSLGLGTGDDASFTRVSASVGIQTSLVQAALVQASTYNGDSVAVTGITGSLNNKLSHGEGIAPFSFNNGASVQVALSASVAGDGLAYAAGVLKIDIDEFSALGSAALHQTQDKFLFSDNGVEKTITFSNLQDAVFADVSGDATVAAGGALTIAAGAVEHGMLAEDIISGQGALTAAADGDTMLISDADDSDTVKKIALSDLQTYFAGGAPQGRGDADVTLSEGVNFANALITANRTWTLPASPADGDKVIVKAARVDPGVYIEVAVDGGGSHVIDSGDPVRLQEDYAAVTLVYVGSNQWMLI